MKALYDDNGVRVQAQLVSLPLPAACAEIDMKQAVTFSEFVRFILFHFYDVQLQKSEYRLDSSEDITASEKKMIHINWDV